MKKSFTKLAAAFLTSAIAIGATVNCVSAFAEDTITLDQAVSIDTGANAVDPTSTTTTTTTTSTTLVESTTTTSTEILPASTTTTTSTSGTEGSTTSTTTTSTIANNSTTSTSSTSTTTTTTTKATTTTNNKNNAPQTGDTFPALGITLTAAAAGFIAYKKRPSNK